MESENNETVYKKPGRPKKEKYDLYNEELKRWFLDESLKDKKINQKSYRVYEFTLSKAYYIAEKKLDKDIYDFSYQEIDMLFYGLEAPALQSLEMQRSIYAKYVDFCIQEGFVKSGINWFSRFQGEDLRKYISVTMEKNRYMTFSNYKDLIHGCANPQDSICIALIYQGAMGESASEITNLTKYDIDYSNGILNLTNHIKKDDKVIEIKKRQLKVTTGEDTGEIDTIDLIRAAINQDSYYRDNGLNSSTFNIYPSEFIVRKVGKDDSKPTRATISDRLRRIGKWSDYKNLSIMNIWYSGMIHFAKRYMKATGFTELKRQDYMYINKHFGYSEERWHDTKRRINKYLNDPKFE
jgi:hypothetical protein